MSKSTVAKATTTAGGGGADKLGNLYEDQWTVLRGVLPVLLGDFEAITVEPPGLPGTGIEFRLHRAEGDEVHQAKRHYKHGWTIAALEKEKVLGAFRQHLEQPGTRAVFVSGQAADALEGLTQKASRVEELSAWQEDLNQPEKEARDALLSKWGVDEETLHGLLARITVERIGASTLSHEVRGRLASTVEGDPGEAFGLLRTFLVTEVNHRLTAHALWGHLKKHGHGPRPGGPDPALSERVRSLAERYSRGVASGRPSRLAFLERTEVAQVADVLTSDDPVRVVTLTGPAGVGKSAICAAIIDELVRCGVLVGALRLDQATAAATEEELGVQPAIGFGGPIAQVMASAAAGDPCVLVIDQLDAMSAAAGRGQPMQGGLRDTLLSLRGVPGLRLLIACRSHDLKYDRGLRQLLGAVVPADSPNAKGQMEVTVGELTDSQVDLALTGLGQPGDMSGQLRVLLRNAFNLSLFADIADAAVRESKVLELAGLATRVDLLRLYHAGRGRVLRDALGPNVFATDVYRVAARMSEDGLLSVPESFLADRTDSRDALLHEGVLVADAGRLRFFHQSYFEYVFAQHHLQQQRTAFELLDGDLQDLLRRGQVRMVLALERDTDPGAYAVDLRRILTDPGVRAHIRVAVLDWLTDTDKASDDELSIVVDCATAGILPRAVRVLATPPYARALADHGLLTTMAKALLAQVEVRREDQVRTSEVADIGLLRSDDLAFVLFEAARTVPEEAATACLPLARERAAAMQWAWALLRLVFLSGPGAGTATATVFSSLTATVREAVLATPGPGPNVTTSELDAPARLMHLLFRQADGLLALRTVLDRAPELALSVFIDWLNAAVAIAQHRRDRHVFEHLLPHEPTGLDTFQRLASHDPVAFAQQVVPLLSDEASRADHPVSWKPADGRGNRPLQRDSIWLGVYIPGVTTFAGELLAAATTALTEAARSQPAAIRPLLATLSSTDLLTAHQLVAVAYAVCDEELVGEALDWAGRPYVRGLPQDGESDADWAAVLAHVAATSTSGQEGACGLALESYPPIDAAAVRGYATDPLPWSLAREQQTVLAKISAALGDRCPSAVLDRLRELSEPLGPPQPMPRVTGGFASRIISPIPDEQALHFNDAEWLATIDTYSSAGSIAMPTGIGGAEEVALQLSEATRREPQRFAGFLADGLPPTANPDYPRAILTGLANPINPLDDVAAEAALRAAQVVFGWPGHPHCREICHLVRSLAGHILPDGILKAIVWTATQADDPTTEVWQEQAPTGEAYYSGRIFDAGLNSDRGYAVDTIAALLAPSGFHAERTNRLVPALRVAVADPLQQVRVMVPNALLCLGQTEPVTSAELTAQWLEISTDATLHAPALSRLAYALFRTDRNLSLDIATRLLAAGEDELRQVGGQLTAALAYSELLAPTGIPAERDATLLLQDALSDTASRTGVANQIAALVSDLPDDIPSPNGDTAPDMASATRPGWQLLIKLLDDSEPSVRKAASDFISALERPLDEYRTLFASIAATRAFAEHSGFLLATISRRTDEIPDNLLNICQKWLEDNADELTHSGGGRGRSASVIEVILSIHARTVEAEVRRHCLDLLDALIEAGVDEASQAADKSAE